MMPSLVRKFLVFAVVDGLVLQPLAQKGQRTASPVKIAYNGGAIGPFLEDGSAHGMGFEAFGVVGLLKVSSSSYLVSITRRQLVAHIHGKPIFVITDVALTPLMSRNEAEIAIEQTNINLEKKIVDKTIEDDSDTDEEEGELSAAASDDVEDEETSPSILRHMSIDGAVQDTESVLKSSIAEDVITRKGGYGRFAQKWFSGKGWTVNQRRNLGMSIADPESVNNALQQPTTGHEALNTDVSDVQAKKIGPGEMPVSEQRNVAATLLPKLLRTTRLLFGSSRSFFFSYDYDITRSIANQRPPNSYDAPLHKDVDPAFFWNRHVLSPFIDAGQYPFVLPLMQGFIGQRCFSVEKSPVVPPVGEADLFSALEMQELQAEDDRNIPESTDSPITNDIQRKRSGVQNARTGASHAKTDEARSFLLTLISRRSVNRAGLRYLRRGVDEEGNAANSVETEQILSSTDWSATEKIYSFLQVRGSIPLFFSQSPYSFKPVPQLQHSEMSNFRAFQEHFSKLSSRYGALQVASLVEKHGVEAHIGEEYERNVATLNESDGINGFKVGFEWFDFHAVCRGMKFENVYILMDTLGPTLDSFGYTTELANKIVKKQIGILRTNCMDCLDRTNVVQSACGRRALEIQLKDEGYDLSIQLDQTTEWFNTLWADNGDAISKQYASTAALKGDFTRTRKRNYKGALTDMGLSISRFYSGIVNDYFSQTAIDFLLGNVTHLVFEDFESNLMSSDPAVSMRKVRQQAIDASQRLVVADATEELVGGWALLTPHMSNTVKSTPFEESVLLLTDAALYACRFDWNMEKVSSFERVDLRHVLKIQWGAYITSTLSAGQADEQKNVGFVVTYKAGVNDITRVNTRSMSTTPKREGSNVPENTSAMTPLKSLKIPPPTPSPSSTKIVSFKALPSRSAVAEKQDVPMMSEIEQVKHICAEIERMALAEQGIVTGSGAQKEIVENGDIISLAEARRSTGLLEQLGHSLKKLVWA